MISKHALDEQESNKEQVMHKMLLEYISDKEHYSSNNKHVNITLHHRGRRDIEDKINDIDNNPEEWLFSDSNNNAQHMSSSASRLEFGPTSIIKSISNTCSQMIGVLRYLNAHAPDKIVQSVPNVDFDTPKFGSHTASLPNTESYHNNSGSNNNYESSTPLPSSTGNQDINCRPFWDRDTQEYRSDAMTCTFSHGQAMIFSDIHQGANSIQLKSYPISGDTYENCGIVNFYGRPSMYCEGHHTNIVYTQNIPPSLDQINAQLALARVGIMLIGKLVTGMRMVCVSSTEYDIDNNSEFGASFTISAHKQKEWNHRIKDILTLIETFKSQYVLSNETQNILSFFAESVAQQKTKIEALGQKSSAENIIDITNSLKTLETYIKEAIDPNPQQSELHQENIQHCNARDTVYAHPEYCVSELHIDNSMQYCNTTSLLGNMTSTGLM